MTYELGEHVDERGTIKDLLIDEHAAVTLVTFKKGVVRGNHYHEKTVQRDFIISGKLECARGPERFIAEAGDMVLHPAGVPHAYMALEDAQLVTCTWGPRKGNDFIQDTIKLRVPLLT